jgi:hypothetical protein
MSFSHERMCGKWAKVSYIVDFKLSMVKYFSMTADSYCHPLPSEKIISRLTVQYCEMA